MTLATIDRFDPDSAWRVGERAVVVGGSMAGLCAARALAPAFQEVVVLERDPLAGEPTVRGGAPQTGQPHVLLEAGRATLEDLFPGFTEAVLAEGGLLIDAGTDMQEYNRGGFLADPGERFPTLCASRPLMEHVVREAVGDHESIRLHGNRRFTDYVTNGTADVTGVAFRGPDGAELTLAADLVVDATGRSSRTPRWLDEHGYEPPTVEEVTIDVTYSTGRVERPPDDRRVLAVPPVAPRTRGAGLIPVEDGRWEVILQGVHGEDPPTDRDGAVAFAEQLPGPEIGQLLRSQRWVSDELEQYPYPASRRHRYDSLDRVPDNLVVLGDALASFNPIYGQGMSVAALEAVLLHQALADGGSDGTPERFFDRASSLVDVVWQTVVGGDFQFPETTGPRPVGTGLSNWYVDRLVRQAHDDPVVSRAFAKVTRLEEPPSALFRPGIAWRVLGPTGGRRLLSGIAGGTDGSDEISST
jgi:2-polyprenyl-6-methoxyphenol hydroxylase-like FAD-dependent oxidoreductase